MSEPSKKKPKQEKKKPKLNIHAKALFIRHIPYTRKTFLAPVDERLRFPKISKQFLVATNSYRVYSLWFSSFSNQKYKVGLEIKIQKLVGSCIASFTSNFEQLQKLSKWLNVGLLDVWFSSGYGQEKLKKEISGFRRVWSELYPDAKINLKRWSSDDYGNFDTMAKLTEELSPRLYRLECHSEILIKTNAKLALNEYFLDNSINIEELKKLMQKGHKIKKLKFYFSRIDSSSDLWWKKPILIQQHLDDFPTNFALNELEISYIMKFSTEKFVDPSEFEALLAFFPNLTKLNLKLSYHCYGDRYDRVKADFKKDVKEPILLALNFIHEFRLILTQKRPSIKVEISYELDFLDADKEGFEAFEDWAKALPDHPEFDGIEKIGPNPGSSNTYEYKLKDGEYYKIFEEYHIIALGWKHGNFTGIINMSVDDKESEDEEE